MGCSLCIVAIFGNFQNALIFPILAVFSSRYFAQNNFNVFVETVFGFFGQFSSLTQTEYFAWAIAFVLWPFLVNFQNSLIFPILAVFSSRYFAQNNFNVFVETVFGFFRQFSFLTQTEYFAWAVAFALWPFLAIFKMLSFVQYELFFQAVFYKEQLLCVCRKVFRMFQAILFFDPN